MISAPGLRHSAGRTCIYLLIRCEGSLVLRHSQPALVVMIPAGSLFKRIALNPRWPNNYETGSFVTGLTSPPLWRSEIASRSPGCSPIRA
jgi:hypothetical protein